MQDFVMHTFYMCMYIVYWLFIVFFIDTIQAHLMQTLYNWYNHYFEINAFALIDDIQTNVDLIAFACTHVYTCTCTCMYANVIISTTLYFDVIEQSEFYIEYLLIIIVQLMVIWIVVTNVQNVHVHVQYIVCTCTCTVRVLYMYMCTQIRNFQYLNYMYIYCTCTCITCCHAHACAHV